MSGRPTRQYVGRFGTWTKPTAYNGSGQCSIMGASILKHAPHKIAVAETRSQTGAKILLCADCLSYVEAYQWAISTGVEHLSEHKLLALAFVWRAEAGYVLPTPLAYRGSFAELGQVKHALTSLVKSGHIKRIGNTYLMRDACPSCFRRGCSAECVLHFASQDFAVRREAHV